MSLRRSLLMSAALLAASSSIALADLALAKVEPSALPAEVTGKGKRIVQAWTWTAKSGAGHLVLSTTQKDTKRGTGRQLFAQLYGPSAKELRLVRDAVANCQLDLVVSFVTDSVSVTDVDADGTPEVAFAYDLDCDARANGSPRKLIVLEGKDKHAVRGTTRGVDPDDKPVGGEFKLDGFKGAPALATWAEARWKELLAVESVAVDP
ncbi:MAG: M949_RS01915 family surface polysaccharide biosynthesis protein [Kofleriaceae bacterium]